MGVQRCQTAGREGDSQIGVLLELDLLEDELLMERVRDLDDRAAFEELVKRYQKKILNFFYRCNVQYDAEDLAQQTFVRLYRYRLNYKKSAKLTTFIFLLARQIWIDELRKRTRMQRLKEGWKKETKQAADPQTAASDACVDLTSALAQLSEDMRLAVELGIYQGLNYSEVARILEIPEGTVKSRIFNALRKLRQILEQG